MSISYYYSVGSQDLAEGLSAYQVEYSEAGNFLSGIETAEITNARSNGLAEDGGVQLSKDDYIKSHFMGKEITLDQYLQHLDKIQDHDVSKGRVGLVNNKGFAAFEQQAEKLNKYSALIMLPSYEDAIKEAIEIAEMLPSATLESALKARAVPQLIIDRVLAANIKSVDGLDQLMQDASDDADELIKEITSR